MIETIQQWGEGITVKILSEGDEHLGHQVELSESLADNAIEGCVWYRCHTCDKEYRYRDVTWLNPPGFEDWEE